MHSDAASQGGCWSGLWRGLLVFIVWIATAGGCAFSAPMTQNEKMK